MKISFCLITLNEEANLDRCLGSFAGLADETVILDSGRTDRTKEIAQAHGARFEVQPWPGNVVQKNRVLALARNDWVFSIDADEALSAELRDEVRAIQAAPPPPAEVGGFDMPRCVLYEGRWIRHGDWYPDRLVRLFRREGAKFVGGNVHGHVEVSGRIRRLRGELEHHSFRDAADHWDRCRKYARLWAESEAGQGRRAGPLAGPSHAAFRFLRSFVLRRGFMDGRLGFRIASYSAREVWLKYRLLRERQGRQGEKR